MHIAADRKDWESGWLGKPAFALALDVADGDDPAVVTREIAATVAGLPRPALVSARVTTPQARRALEACGFHLIEEFLRFRAGGDRVLAAEAVPDMRPAVASDRPRLTAMAREAFSFDRFHRDPDVPHAAASESRAQWVANALLDEKKQVAVAVESGAIAGFVIHRLPGATGNSVLDLLAVAPEARGRGIGKALARHCLSLARASGANAVSVGTQAENIASIRCYSACGFVLSDVSHTYHLHLARSTS